MSFPGSLAVLIENARNRIAGAYRLVRARPPPQYKSGRLPWTGSGPISGTVIRGVNTRHSVASATIPQYEARAAVPQQYNATVLEHSTRTQYDSTNGSTVQNHSTRGEGRSTATAITFSKGLPEIGTELLVSETWI
eukprot:1193352-Rhodomonas_salina.1